VQSIILNIVDFSGINKFLLWIGAKAVLNRIVTNAAMGMIKKALQKHELLKQEEQVPKNAAEENEG